MTKRILLHPVAHVLSIIGLILAVYTPAIDAPFVFDDFDYILKGPLEGRTATLVSAAIADDHSEHIEGRSAASWASIAEFNRARRIGTRFLGYLSFHMNRRLGGDETGGYHLLNIGVHAASSVALYMFVLALTVAAGMERRALALLAGALFAVHPIETQAVTYLTGRFTSMAALWCLISIASYAWWAEAVGPARRLALRAVSVLAMACAMLTKESAFLFPLWWSYMTSCI